jgi:D-inositol-3-phosphate glycosyltransferase
LNALLRRASSVIAPSDDTARRWVDVAGLDRSRVSAVPTGVDPDHFVPRQDDERQAVRDRLGIDGRSRLVLFAGRLERIKGAHILLAAVRRLPDPVAVVLCGAGTDDAFRAELEAAADSGVSFLGRRSDMADLMAAADLVVVPSIWNDPQPLVVGEAMACGTPVVASDIGGLTTSLAGFPEHLFPPGDVDRLVAVLAATVNWRDDDPGLGPRSRDWALAHFSLSRTFDTIDRILTTAQR